MALLGLWGVLALGTAVFFILTVIGLIWNYTPIPPNFKDRGLVTTMIITAFFSMWFMWAIVYMSQMYILPGVAPMVEIPAGAPEGNH